MIKSLLFIYTFFFADPSSFISQSAQDPKEDAKIVNGTGFCNKPWEFKNLKNNSTSKFITVTVQETKSDRAGTYRRTIVLERVAPQEERALGCSGCGETTTGRQCTSYAVLAAVYVE
jgi:hypothetical protein